MNHRAKDKEFTGNQRLKQENEKLKRQLERLRKQLSRLDLENYSNLREIIEAQQREDEAFESKEKEEKEEKNKRKKEDVSKIWQCHKCSTDYLRLVMISRPDGDFYLRRCPTCKNRTKLKRFTKDVKDLDR